MTSKDFKLNSDGGDTSRCQTHRILEFANSVVKEMSLRNIDNASGEFSPKIASWRPSKVNNNTVVLHRPIRNVNPNKQNEKVTSAKSVENINDKHNKLNVLTISKSFSVCNLPKPKTERSSSTRKYCKIDSFDESDDGITLRNESLTLERHGFYESNGSLRLSLSSLTSTSTQEDQEAYELARRDAFNDWLLRKESEKKERNKRLSNKNHKDEKLSTDQREQLFRKWLEKKHSIKEAEKARKLMEEKQAFEEKKQQRLGKEDKIREWSRKKDEAKKEHIRRQKERADALACSKERRRKEGEEAYQRWLKQAKNKPLPVPLNKGELSMRGSVSSMYINPEPWKSPDNKEEMTSTTTSI